MVNWNWKFNISKVAWKVILSQPLSFEIYCNIFPSKSSNKIPSHFPASEVPQDSHRPNSSGSPRNGFPSWLAWLIWESLIEAVLYQQKNRKFPMHLSNLIKYWKDQNTITKPSSNKYCNQKLLLLIWIKTKSLTSKQQNTSFSVLSS